MTTREQFKERALKMVCERLQWSEETPSAYVQELAEAVAIKWLKRPLDQAKKTDYSDLVLLVRAAIEKYSEHATPSGAVEGQFDADGLLDYVRGQHTEYAFIAANAKDPAKKLAAECREVAYFDVIKAWERAARERKG